MLFDRKQAIYIILASFIYAFIAGIRMPNIWSATHYLFDYEFWICQKRDGRIYTTSTF